MQISKTAYNRELLKKWKASETTEEKISEMLCEHLILQREVILIFDEPKKPYDYF